MTNGYDTMPINLKRSIVVEIAYCSIARDMLFLLLCGLAFPMVRHSHAGAVSTERAKPERKKVTLRIKIHYDVSWYLLWYVWNCSGGRRSPCYVGKRHWWCHACHSIVRRQRALHSGEESALCLELYAEIWCRCAVGAQWHGIRVWRWRKLSPE